MSLADYLAKNYLTADSKPEKKSKKRKRKEAGLVIADDDALGWNPNGNVHADEDAPLTVSSTSAEFRKAKSNQWQTIGVPAPSSSEQATADALIAAAAAEATARKLADDDDGSAISSAMMESGARAGLQTASQVSAQQARKQAAERQRFAQDGDSHIGRGAETIYRDASGRVINIAMARAEARAKADAETAKQAAAVDAARGDVQRAERQNRREQLSDAKFLSVARYADDEALNAELKDQQRWDDPARAFLRPKSAGKSASGKPLYAGPAAMPNRYGIRPGYRWDGVDRGNGFEREYFAARNRRKDLSELEYKWQTDE